MPCHMLGQVAWHQSLFDHKLCREHISSAGGQGDDVHLHL